MVADRLQFQKLHLEAMASSSHNQHRCTHFHARQTSRQFPAAAHSADHFCQGRRFRFKPWRYHAILHMRDCGHLCSRTLPSRHTTQNNTRHHIHFCQMLWMEFIRWVVSTLWWVVNCLMPYRNMESTDKRTVEHGQCPSHVLPQQFTPQFRFSMVRTMCSVSLDLCMFIRLHPFSTSFVAKANVIVWPCTIWTAIRGSRIAL